MITFDVMMRADQEAQRLVELTQFVEGAGLSGVWIGDSPPLRWTDTYMVSALCAQATSNVFLGPGVTNPVTRHSSVTASAMATLHQLSGGRAKLGIGFGYSAVRAVGLAPAKLADMETYIAEVRKGLEQRDISLPVYIAASGPKGLEMAGRIGDGAIVSIGTHPALLKQALRQVHKGAEEAGRDPAKVDVVFLVATAVSDNWEEARMDAAPMAARRALDILYHPSFFPEELEDLRVEAEKVAQQYNVFQHSRPGEEVPHNRMVTDSLIDAFAMAGTAEQCAAKLQRMEEIGATHIALGARGDDQRGGLERFVDQVLPLLG
jgi:5,10-methylenetetrahydromethanopterin reductase